jgi:hypothetical protein
VPEPLSSEAFDARYPEADSIEFGKLRSWWERGGHAPWRRVWSRGIDVTDADPATWPPLWAPEFRSRSRAYRRHI